MAKHCRGCHNLRHEDNCSAAMPGGRFVCSAGHPVYLGEHGPETDENCEDRRPLSWVVLTAKLGALDDVAHACRIGQRMLPACKSRMEAGHREHNDDVFSMDAGDEACQELLDLVNYAAIARLQGSWSWRWRVAGWLAGIAWRVLEAARVIEEGQQ